MEEGTEKLTAVLKLILTNREDLVEQRKVEGNFGESDYKTTEFTNLKKGRNESSRIRTMEFKKADFIKLRELEGRVSWEDILRKKGLQESSQLLKGTILKIQWQTVMMQRKHMEHSKRPIWLHQKLRKRKRKAEKYKYKYKSGNKDLQI